MTLKLKIFKFQSVIFDLFKDIIAIYYANTDPRRVLDPAHLLQSCHLYVGPNALTIYVDIPLHFNDP
uniref:Ovule protein n=1 Tax=Strongyloides venezuelensis TaxID=75913 RepID=A0A0K0F084_STRVS